MGRKSTGEYPPNWNEIAARVKEEAGWKCVRCGHDHEPTAGYTLTVHHLDLNKSNCDWWNLPALCQRCHLSIQGKVIMERPWFLPHSDWFKPYVAGYYASVLGLPTDKELILPHLEELIAIGQAGFLAKPTERAFPLEMSDVVLLDALWPSLEDVPDGEDILAEKYGPPSGEEA